MSTTINTVNSQSTISALSSGDLGVCGTTSLQFMFAQLQMELAKAAKESAMDKMEQIKTSQEERKQVSALLNECRQQQANAESGIGDCPWDKKASMMSEECQKYMDDHKLAYDKTGNDRANNPDEWKVAITSLEGRLDEVGSDTQQLMVYVQDFMGQYNSYLQGANTQISNGNQTLQALARGQ
ncbi:MAG: USH1C-binding protein 1 [Deltaproteobacteria bacterium]|nr:USH1C-binding protein 1 [Deltaproteobacteria bacterium]